MKRDNVLSNVRGMGSLLLPLCYTENQKITKRKGWLHPKKRGLLAGLLLAFFAGNSQVLITQYYAGVENDKYLEITNFGATAYDLAANGIRAYSYANERADDPAGNTASFGQALTGVIPALGSMLFKNGFAANPAYAMSSAIGVNFCGFNGDDLILLSTATDGLTVSGSGWNNRIDVVGDGTDWGTDLSMYRNSDVVTPNATFTLSEWTTITNAAADAAAPTDAAYLGYHASVLPVSLFHLQGQHFDDQVRLTFATATEANNAYFLVQRSTDGGQEFQTIGRVEGQGNSNERVDYEFVDTRPAAGLNYYRLQQFDYDGTNEFFGLIAVRFDGELAVVKPAIWPVPVRGRLQIDLPASSNPDWQLEVYDLNGRRLLFQQVDEKNTNTFFDLHPLPAGTYLLRWANGAASGQERFLKL
ncbi:MAG: hypothetical protein DA408_15080 [Bacteroidetes bacterium]|nr:MAG: hypothetical protein C7N36_12940 [Bacteroidota bacterium]PTM10790.1 MAG: hypothetical protein DA408_15080 [Bacteroidota bacterium]